MLPSTFEDVGVGMASFKVIAEGVEIAEQLAKLRELECDLRR